MKSALARRSSLSVHRLSWLWFWDSFMWILSTTEKQLRSPTPTPDVVVWEWEFKPTNVTKQQHLLVGTNVAVLSQPTNVAVLSQPTRTRWLPSERPPRTFCHGWNITTIITTTSLLKFMESLPSADLRDEPFKMNSQKKFLQAIFIYVSEAIWNIPNNSIHYATFLQGQTKQMICNNLPQSNSLDPFRPGINIQHLIRP